LFYAKPSPSNELWGPLFEKFYAKVSGNYEMIEGGWPTEVMRFLTGAPSYTYYIKDFPTSTVLNDVWNLVREGDALNLIMTAGTPSAVGGDSTTNAVGLAMNHAYTIIGAVELMNEDGTVRDRLFKMRNPWGSDGAYKGAYCDADPIWNTVFTTGSNYATQVNFTNANDGVFYIKASDFVTYYSGFVISHYHDGW
jgi:hypothetical protein